MASLTVMPGLRLHLALHLTMCITTLLFYNIHPGVFDLLGIFLVQVI